MEHEQARQDERRHEQAEPEPDRKPYGSPTLVRLGDMKDVTLQDSGGGCGCSDGGS